MDRVRVSSTNLLSVGYDLGSLVLEQEFQDRAIYLHDHIKDRFHYRRVR